MDAPMVTVVIPVYKTEKWLHRCISSVAAQHWRNLEILLIDDGSPDGCPQICDSWAARDSRIRVIHKENEGLGMARNTGMAAARGEYLCFVDSDDCLEECAIGDALALSRKEQADIVLYGMTCIAPSGKVTTRRVPRTEKTVYSGREVQTVLLPKLIAGEGGLTMSACCCLISGSLIRRAGWQFPSEREIISEDVYALLGLYRYVDKAAVLPSAPYCYYENDQSLTHSYREERFAQVRHFYRESLALCRACGYGPEVMQQCAAPFLSFSLAAMKQETARSGACPRLKAMLADETLRQALREYAPQNQGWKKQLFWRCIRSRRYGLGQLLLLAQNRIQ